MRVVEAYLAAVEMALLLVLPILLAMTIGMWIVAFKLWPYKLPLALALAGTVVGACGTWLGYTVLYRSRIGPVPVEFLPVTATSIFLLVTVPFMVIAYVLYLAVTRNGAGSEREHTGSTSQGLG